ncbi:hypothetical protein RAMDARK_1080 [Rickettsia amblyommatis str. Darkwater]|uniref:Uncharacterized protein n=1 Tax=Rickettsia amblyommatis str. Ac/Pa TaxID=1359164 RepID=A0A0F3N3X7_RICAM|nr:hypothetical protein APHACPA_1422 [Rickettsia amblyommatis str. Ac/Pa]KJV91327.1 hypothetical protein RAMDARK_1080 [Rickettsia amblyommatis str. Darkwater]
MIINTCIIIYLSFSTSSFFNPVEVAIKSVFTPALIKFGAILIVI